jgi:cytochrome c biogenesis protein CcmG, thiol:disulfide interchange protein DsbE
MGNPTSQKLAGFLIVIATILWTPESSRAEVADLLQKLNMTTYSRRTLPPEFNGRMVDGREMSLASLQGKVVFLNFWAAWCLECRPEMPALERLHRELSAQGLAVVGINARERAATIREYAQALGLTFPLILDPSGKINSNYGVIGLPTTFLIARDGRAVALAIGPREWSGKPARAVIQALLAEPAALKGTR